MAIYVSGFLCQEVLKEEGSGVISAIRIADRLTVTVQRSIPQHLIPATEVHVLVFYRSEQQEEFDSSIRIIDPDGNGPTPRTDRINTGGGTRGHMSDVTLRIQVGKSGVWWVEVSVGTETRLRIPFEIMHVQADTSDAPSNQPQTGA